MQKEKLDASVYQLSLKSHLPVTYIHISHLTIIIKKKIEIIYAGNSHNKKHPLSVHHANIKK